MERLTLPRHGCSNRASPTIGPVPALCFLTVPGHRCSNLPHCPWRGGVHRGFPLLSQSLAAAFLHTTSKDCIARVGCTVAWGVSEATTSRVHSSCWQLCVPGKSADRCSLSDAKRPPPACPFCAYPANRLIGVLCPMPNVHHPHARFLPHRQVTTPSPRTGCSPRSTTA